MATARNETGAFENFVCSICLDIYENPVTLPCGNNHTFCASCIDPQRADLQPTCTLCRQPYNPAQVTLNRQIKTIMRSQRVTCSGCHEQVILCEMRKHQGTCAKIDRTIKLFQPIRETSQRIPRDTPNRQTFHCPYCNKANFDSRGLVEHCNKSHSHEPIAVVCPICTSMPWGDKNQISSNFIQHLNMRHKFEYDTYVDYQQDDDEMLRAAIQASLGNS